MPGSDLPEEVRSLIARCIHSALELEILLAVHRGRERAWRAEDVTAELRTPQDASADALGALAQAGILAREGDSYSYAPKTGELARTVDALADAYVRNRVRVIEFLYSRPSDRITTFADAFRLKRGK